MNFDFSFGSFMNAFMEKTQKVTNTVYQTTKSVAQSVVTTTVEATKATTSVIFNSAAQVVNGAFEIAEEVVTLPFTAMKVLGEALQNANYQQQYAYHDM